MRADGAYTLADPDAVHAVGDDAALLGTHQLLMQDALEMKRRADEAGIGAG